MAILEIINIGDALGVIIPDEMLEKWTMSVGDAFEIKDAPIGIDLIPIRPTSS